MLRLTTTRHAIVVPSVVLPLLKQGLKWRSGRVAPEELTAWARADQLSEHARDELAAMVVARLRPKGRIMQDLLCGQLLCSGGQERMGGMDLRMVQSFIDRLPVDRRERLLEVTIGEFSTGIAKPLAFSLRLLAKLEAAQWEVSGPPANMVEHASQSVLGEAEAATHIETQAFKDDLALVQSLPWVAEVAATDLRFRTDSIRPPSQVLAEAVASNRWSEVTCHLVHELARCDRMTFAEEVEDLARRALRLIGTRDGARARWVKMFTLRYVSPVDSGRTLVEVGAQFDVTREYVRQVCEKMLGALREHTIFAPATARVLTSALRIAPESVAGMNVQLARQLGEGGGFEAAVFFASEMGMETSSLTVHESFISQGKSRVYSETVNRTGETGFSQAVLRCTGRQISLMGCTNLWRVSGALALDDELAPGRAAVESVLVAATGFKWLDQECGWFTLGDRGESSAVAKRIRKLASAAEEPVTIEAIISSLVTDDLWLYRERERDTGVPPMHILTQLLRCWPWLKCLQHNRFSLCDPSVADVLTPTETLIIKVIKEFGGVASRYELSDRIVKEFGLGDIRVQQILGTAPMIYKIEWGLYALRGHRQADNALANARNRAQARRQEDSPHGIESDAKFFILNISAGSLKNEQYGLPAAWSTRVPAGKYIIVCVDGQGEVLEHQPAKATVKVRESGVMVGFNRCFPTAKPGDRYVVEPAPGNLLRVGLRTAQVQEPSEGAPPVAFDASVARSSP